MKTGLTHLLLLLLDLVLAASLILLPILWLYGTLSLGWGPLHFSVRWGVWVFPALLMLFLIRAGLYHRFGSKTGFRGLWQYSPVKKMTLLIGSLFLLLYGFEQILVLLHYQAQLPSIVIKGSQKEIIGRDGIVGDAETGWKFSPGGMFKGWKINSMGFREREVDPVKKPGSQRVICLGDSCTADGGPPYSTCLDQLLRQAPPTANEWEAFNMAVYGFSSVNGLKLFRKKGRHLQPDYVTIFFGWNDHWLCGYRPDSANLSIELSPRAATAYELMKRKLIGQLLFRVLTRGQNLSLPMSKGKLPADIEDYLRVPQEEYRKVLKMMVAEIRAVGATPVFITAPRRADLTHLLVYNGQAKSLEMAAKLHDEYCDITREVAQSTDSVLLDLRAMFVDPEENRQLFTKDGIHFSQQGLWRVAEELYHVLRREAAPADYEAWSKNRPLIGTNLAAMAARWSGWVENDTNRFELALQITAPAGSNGTCATLRVGGKDEGELRFVRLEGNTVLCTGTTARIDCPLGAFDQFRLLPDGSLLYSSRSDYGLTIGVLHPSL